MDDIPRNANGQFGKGYHPRRHGVDPDRNRNVGGRRRILMVFDRVVGEECHLGRLETEIRKRISDVGMLEFYRTYVLPLLPKEMIVSALNLNVPADGATLDPTTPEGIALRDQTLREIFGLNKIADEHAEYTKGEGDGS